MAELFEVTGMADLQRRLEQLPPQVVFLAGIALEQEADAILEQSQSLVPIDTGELRASGHTDPVTLTATTAQCGVRYGGPGTGQRRPEDYAIRIEFDVTLRHPRGGQAFFLSEPTFAAIQGMGERIAEAIRIAL